jgi:RecJ-like exonuclease
MVQPSKDRSVICPACDGIFVDPFAKRCKVCQGKGKVDLGKICYCGRPALFTKDNEEVCGSPLCSRNTDKTDLAILEEFQNSTAWMGI